VAGTPKLAARKQWMVDHLQLRGAVWSTTARRQAARRRQEPAAHRRARGAGRIRARRRDRGAHAAGRRTGPRPGQLLSGRGAADRAQALAQIEALLGYANEPELIHRDNLVSW
jgi:glutamate 5-kinase